MHELTGKIQNGTILLHVIDVKKTTESGIIIPETSINNIIKGTVILIGKSKYAEPMEILIGDTIYFNPTYGTKINIDQKDYVLLQQSDILYIETKN